MKCPMKFNNPCCDVDEECDSECAWLLECGTVSNDDRVCAIAVLASSGTEPMGFSPINRFEEDHD